MEARVRIRVATLLPAVATIAACTGPGGTAVTLLDYRANAPAHWRAHPPSSEMRLAEFFASDGADPAQVVVYYFGPGEGGSAAANIARWTSQFSAADGGPVTPRVNRTDGSAFTTTVAELEGRYDRGIGMGADGTTAKPDQTLVAAVVETPRGNVFVQLFGPTTEVTPQRDEFLGFVRSIRPAGD
jgi:hypothetical protein